MQKLSWPQTDTFYLTLDLECDYGTALRENTYEAIEGVDELIHTLEQYNIPVTCFVQTELLEEKPEAVELLRNSSVDVLFHPHSHTHKPREETDIAKEVKISTDLYRQFFGSEPTGYRFPNGNVRREDYRVLSTYSYEFDASVFPSWRPNHFNNTSTPLVPQYLTEFDLVEVPFTVYSRQVRIPTALSYSHLLGQPFRWLLTKRPPSVVVYNIHMHDLVTPDSYADLSRFYRMVYSRVDDGFEYLEQVFNAFEEKGYSFSTLDDTHQQLQNKV